MIPPKFWRDFLLALSDFSKGKYQFTAAFSGHILYLSNIQQKNFLTYCIAYPPARHIIYHYFFYETALLCGKTICVSLLLIKIPLRFIQNNFHAEINDRFWKSRRKCGR